MEINLLPWRDEAIAYNRKLFVILMTSALSLACALLVYLYFQLFDQVRFNQVYVDSLQRAKIVIGDKNKAFVEHQKTYEESGKRLLTLIGLRYNRYETVRLFNEITKIVPKGVYLNRMIRKGSNVELQGVSDSNLLIAQMIKSIEVSPDLVVVSLEKVERKEGDDLITVTDFKMQLSIRSPYNFEEKSKTEEKDTGTISTVLKILMNRDKNLENIYKKNGKQR